MMGSVDYVGKTLKVIIDRPMGSRHPHFGFIYPVNYGYLPGQFSGDGEELDAYVLGVFEPLTQFEGVCIAVLHRVDDVDDKLILAPPGRQFSDEQISALTEFQERLFDTVIIRSESTDYGP